MHLFGDKQKFAINTSVSKIIPEKGILCGGLELWLNNYLFGDIEVIDFITGNNYYMIERLQVNSIPSSNMLPLQNDYSAFDLIYRNFTGETVNAHQLTFQEAADHDKFWSKFVLCPNGTMEFDPYFIFYYKLEDNVRFVFKINNERNIESVLLPINYVNDVSTKCLEFYNQLLASQAK